MSSLARPLTLWAFALPLALVHLPASAETRCSCPTISAEGEGNTTCSANESGGLCTVDYNLFSEREVRAAKVLNEQFDLDFTAFPDLNTEQSLETAERNGMLFEQVFLYLLVAAVDQLTRHPETVDRDSFVNLLELVDEVRPQIEEAFSQRSFQRSLAFPADNADIVDLGEVVVSSGCVEVNNGRQWVMLKTFWSPLAQSPGCRP